MTSPTNLRRFTVTETREAVEVTADNLDEVAAWCGGTTRRDLGWVEYPLIPPTDSYDTDYVGAGHVLVTDGTRWWDMTREEFKRTSEQWTEENT